MAETRSSSIAQVLQSLDVILVGVGTPFAVQNFIQNRTSHGLFIGIGYFLALINFFHAKFSLTLAADFEAFSSQIGTLLNFINLTLRIVLSGSFIFMAFYLSDPIHFIYVNLVMRSCDLCMVLILLFRIDSLNLPQSIRKDLKHVHRYWLIGTVLFFLFYFLSIWSLNCRRMTPQVFAVLFFAFVCADTCFDYYWNRSFYFQPLRALVVEKLVNSKSAKYTQAESLFATLPFDIRECARTELYDTVAGNGQNPSRADVWCAISSERVLAVSLLSILPRSRSLALRYISVSDPMQWLQLSGFLTSQSLLKRIRLRTFFSDMSVIPTAVVVNVREIFRQVPPDISDELPELLSHLGFRASSISSDLWILTKSPSKTLSEEIQVKMIEEWNS